MSQTCSTSEPSPAIDARISFLTSLRAACLASLQARSDSCAELLTSVGSGPTPSESCASFDPDSVSLRTRQLSLLLSPGTHGTESCRDWSRSGMICGGMYFPLPRLVQGICGSESSSFVPTPRAGKHTSEEEESWQKRKDAGKVETRPLSLYVKTFYLPTPTANDGVKRGTAYLQEHREGTTFGDNLPRTIAKHLLPTPTARDYKDTPGMARTAKDGKRERDDQLPRRIYADESQAPTGGMRLTPEFLCWLQGYPPGWLKPLVTALGTASSRKRSCP